MTTKNIVPRADNEGGIGTALKKWAVGFIKVLTVDSITIGTLSTQNPPVDADLFIYRASAAAWALVTSTGTQIKAYLKTYFDLIYDALGSAAALARDPDQSVVLTYVGSGSSGIMVADNVNINFGTGNFALVWKGSLPDWTLTAYVIWRYQNATTYVFVGIGADGTILLEYAGGGTAKLFTSTLPTGIIDGAVGDVCISVIRETSTVPGNVSFSVNGIKLGDDVSISSASGGGSLINTAPLYYMGNQAARIAGTCIHAYTLNFAPTAAEVLDMYGNGIPESWKLAAGQTALTSGTLVVGKNYQIDTFAAGDDFTNAATVISGTINTAGCRFTCKAAAPTSWANGSSLRPAVGTLILTPESWQSDKPYDCSSNNLVCAYPATGWSLTRPNPKKLWQPTPAAKTTAVTLTIAELLTGIITATHTAGATQAYTLPTGALCDAWPAFGMDRFFDWTLINLSAAAADTVTVTAAATGHTIVGNPIVQSAHATTGGIYGNSAMFRTRKTAANTFVTYRIG